MAIVEVRIDDRLIHGQVVGYWVPQYKVDRILIVDNEIVNDEARKAALKFGCPPGCKLSIFDSTKAAEKLGRNIDKGIRVMILTRGPQPLLEMVEKGYSFDNITIGNMSTKEGAKSFKKTVFLTSEERKAFSKLAGHHVDLYFQMAPKDTRENVTASFAE